MLCDKLPQHSNLKMELLLYHVASAGPEGGATSLVVERLRSFPDGSCAREAVLEVGRSSCVGVLTVK